MEITEFIIKTGEIMKCIICGDVFTGSYTSYLLGGEFSNCYGQGSTPDESVRGLKMRIYQLRNK